jgi:hypothetical protein
MGGCRAIPKVAARRRVRMAPVRRCAIQPRSGVGRPQDDRRRPGSRDGRGRRGSEGQLRRVQGVSPSFSIIRRMCGKRRTTGGFTGFARGSFTPTAGFRSIMPHAMACESAARRVACIFLIDFAESRGENELKNACNSTVDSASSGMFPVQEARSRQSSTRSSQWTAS